MADSTTYREWLKHPNWQRKRLEILERDNFTCVLCGENNSTVHVHHWKYVWGNKPWEYDNYDLATLCEKCHGLETAHRKRQEAFLLSVLRRGQISVSCVYHLAFSLMEMIGEPGAERRAATVFKALRMPGVWDALQLSGETGKPITVVSEAAQ